MDSVPDERLTRAQQQLGSVRLGGLFELARGHNAIYSGRGTRFELLQCILEGLRGHICAGDDEGASDLLERIEAAARREREDGILVRQESEAFVGGDAAAFVGHNDGAHAATGHTNFAGEAGPTPNGRQDTVAESCDVCGDHFRLNVSPADYPYSMSVCPRCSFTKVVPFLEVVEWLVEPAIITSGEVKISFDMNKDALKGALLASRRIFVGVSLLPPPHPSTWESKKAPIVPGAKYPPLLLPDQATVTVNGLTACNLASGVRRANVLTVPITHRTVTANSVHLACPGRPTMLFGVALVNQLSVDTVKQRLLAQPLARPSLEDATADVVRCFGDDECVVESESVSLKDWCTWTLMQTPIKGRDCRHVRGLDLEGYLQWLQSRKNGATPSCPLCHKPMYIDEVKLDAFLEQALAHPDVRSRKAEEIKVFADGRWQPIVAQREVVVVDISDDEADN